VFQKTSNAVFPAMLSLEKLLPSKVLMEKSGIGSPISTAWQQVDAVNRTYIISNGITPV
jgi:hypothetical protein